MSLKYSRPVMEMKCICSSLLQDRNIFAEGELVRDSVVAKNATTAADGKSYQVEYQKGGTASAAVREFVQYLKYRD